METQRVERKLLAVLAADVAGYSRLVGIDEDGTLARLRSIRLELIDPAIAEHRGRIIKTTGDGILVEFPSVVDAVRCALAVQRSMAERNAEIAADRLIAFRIGIHLGDVVVDGADLLGDGVNIAARLEGIADPGGISLSEDVWRQVRDKLPETFVDLGEQMLKNIARPMRVYRIDLAGAAEAPHLTLALPDKPSIAVLPFTNMSDDRDQEYFADGISEDIITALARFPSLFVIARNSSFTYKARSVDVKQIGRELGVRYVLEGSVRKAGKHVRLTGQLVQADNGMHVWAERYDGDLSDIFALQDEMTASVVGAVVPSLQNAEIERARRKPAGSLDAYDLQLRALPKFYAQDRESNQQALQLVEQALTLDPNFVAALILAENCWSLMVNQGWLPAPQTQPEVMRYARRAVQIDKDNAEALATLARRTAGIERDYEEAVSLAERAVALNPNSAFAWRQSGYALVYCGRPEPALAYLQRAIRLSPRDPRAEDCWTGIALALIQLERDTEAAAAARKAVQANPNSASTWRAFAAALALTGQLDEARTAIRRLLAIDPTCTLTVMAVRQGYTDKAKARYFDGMRQAGLPA